MNDNPLQALFGFDYIPFRQSVVSDALWKRLGLEALVTRVESHIQIGGFTPLSGNTGPDKSKALKMLVDHLDQLSQLAVPRKEQNDE
jgi:hypothetical protein